MGDARAFWCCLVLKGLVEGADRATYLPDGSYWSGKVSIGTLEAMRAGLIRREYKVLDGVYQDVYSVTTRGHQFYAALDLANLDPALPDPPAPPAPERLVDVPHSRPRTRCSRCGGSGEVEGEYSSWFGTHPVLRCPRCNGSGHG